MQCEVQDGKGERPEQNLEVQSKETNPYGLKCVFYYQIKNQL